MLAYAKNSRQTVPSTRDITREWRRFIDVTPRASRRSLTKWGGQVLPVSGKMVQKRHGVSPSTRSASLRFNGAACALSKKPPRSAQRPRGSRFLGIVIGIFYNEHGVAHFHAVYGEHEISVEVESGVIHGNFPPRALRHVLEWATLHKQELLNNWELARRGNPLNRIAPLE